MVSGWHSVAKYRRRGRQTGWSLRDVVRQHVVQDQPLKRWRHGKYLAGMQALAWTQPSGKAFEGRQAGDAREQSALKLSDLRLQQLGLVGGGGSIQLGLGVAQMQLALFNCPVGVGVIGVGEDAQLTQAIQVGIYQRQAGGVFLIITLPGGAAVHQGRALGAGAGGVAGVATGAATGRAGVATAAFFASCGSGVAGSASRAAGDGTGALAGRIAPDQTANRTANVNAGNGGRLGGAGAAGGGG